ncbi:major facilitator superfamily transporter [Pseudomonas aeruginosa]|nr:major facilitator superfamily transporter [Pseudomonas aeruginosa]
MLTVPAAWLTIPWVMGAQAMSGIAKDLNKMSAKSSIKLLVPDNQQGTLYKWVAVLTGSKNALKGVGFFLRRCVAGIDGLHWCSAGDGRRTGPDLDSQPVPAEERPGKAKAKPKFRDILSKSRAINILSAARLFLFGARDVWFVVALPVYLSTVFGWDFWLWGGFLASWVIGYGIVQSFAPNITGKKRGHVPDGRAAFVWASLLAGLPAAIALGLSAGLSPQVVLLGGLMLFGVLFAVNSSLHSYLIVSYAKEDGVSLDVGFYYMSNALGRLIGYVTLGLGIPGLWSGGLPVGFQCVCAGRCADFHRLAQALDAAPQACQAAQSGGPQASAVAKNCSISVAVLRAVRVTPIRVAEADPVHSP